MKKFLFALAGIALVAASCTQTEIIDNDNQATTRSIGFSVYTARQTRAAQQDVDRNNLTSFQVSAIGNGAMYFKDVEFTYGEGAVWKSTPAYYWPAYPLTFCAYNKPAKGTLTPEINVGEQMLKYEPSETLAEQEDLVAAWEKNVTKSTSETSLPHDITFNHYLTQVIVKAKCSNANYTVKVSSVKVANLAGEGTYTFNDNTMTPTAGLVNSGLSKDYSADLTTPKELDGTAVNVMTDDDSGRWYLIPQFVERWNNSNLTNSDNKTYLALKVNISTNGGAQIYPKSGDAAWIAVSVPAELAFAQGRKYNVTIDFFGRGGAGYVDPEEPGELDGDPGTDDRGKPIVGSQITFNAEVNGWDTVDVNISL